MTTNEHIQFVLQIKKSMPSPQNFDEAAVFEAAQLISGGFTILLRQEKSSEQKLQQGQRQLRARGMGR